MQEGEQHGKEKRPRDAVLDKGGVSEICRCHDGQALPITMRTCFRPDRRRWQIS